VTSPPLHAVLDVVDARAAFVATVPQTADRRRREHLDAHQYLVVATAVILPLSGWLSG